MSEFSTLYLKILSPSSQMMHKIITLAIMRFSSFGLRICVL